MAKKRGRIRAYTEIGSRIAGLGERQRHLAAVLEVSQQTISKKLRGETAILVSDLEKLGKHYDVPLTYFFEEEAPSPEIAVALRKVRRRPGVIHELLQLVSAMSDARVRKVLDVAKAMAQTR